MTAEFDHFDALNAEHKALAKALEDMLVFLPAADYELVCAGVQKCIADKRKMAQIIAVLTTVVKTGFAVARPFFLGL
jgi:hypothetical protein